MPPLWQYFSRVAESPHVSVAVPKGAALTVLRQFFPARQPLLVAPSRAPKGLHRADLGAFEVAREQTDDFAGPVGVPARLPKGDR
jgi:hypothetical protein